MFFALFSFLPVLLMERLGLSLAGLSAPSPPPPTSSATWAGMLLGRGVARSTLIAHHRLIALLIFRSARRP